MIFTRRFGALSARQTFESFTNFDTEDIRDLDRTGHEAARLANGDGDRDAAGSPAA